MISGYSTSLVLRNRPKQTLFGTLTIIVVPRPRLEQSKWHERQLIRLRRFGEFRNPSSLFLSTRHQSGLPGDEYKGVDRHVCSYGTDKTLRLRVWWSGYWRWRDACNAGPAPPVVLFSTCAQGPQSGPQTPCRCPAGKWQGGQAPEARDHNNDKHVLRTTDHPASLGGGASAVASL